MDTATEEKGNKYIKKNKKELKKLKESLHRAHKAKFVPLCSDAGFYTDILVLIQSLSISDIGQRRNYVE